MGVMFRTKRINESYKFYDFGIKASVKTENIKKNQKCRNSRKTPKQKVSLTKPTKIAKCAKIVKNRQVSKML